MAEDTRRDAGAGLSAQRIALRGQTHIGPLGHLAHERSHMAAQTWHHFEVVPVGATVGGLVTEIDLCGDVSNDVYEELRLALDVFKVLFFRDQPMTPDRHLALARAFGELEVHPFLAGNSEHPELVRFEKSAEVGGYENAWHNDVTWRKEPSAAGILRAISVPASGGDTLFCDMAAAFGGLDPDLAERVSGLSAIHDYSMAFGHHVPEDQREEMNATYPPVEHPVVIRHHRTGKPTLYVNRYFTREIVGLAHQESEELIEVLCRQSDVVEYQCRFQWAPNSVAIWDNRAVQHYAASDYWPDVRIMERASARGPRPAA